MNVIHISAECYPVAKVGGLADVVGALPIYQNKLGVSSTVIMPFYDNVFTQTHQFTTLYRGSLSIGSKKIPFSIVSLKKSELNFDLVLVDIPALLHTPYVYSADDTERFIAFQTATLDYIISQQELPTIIHCHDHHTGLIPFLMSHGKNYTALKEIPSILTIHNAQYQGWFDYEHLPLIPDFDRAKIGLLDWNSTINPLAAAIKTAWQVVTVSPSYMAELQVNANGLETLLQHEKQKCTGILNGIDTTVWNPATDQFLPKTFGINNVQSGKKANKKWLCKRYQLDPKKPLFVFIGRLVREKGADLFNDVFTQALTENDIAILLLGSGQSDIEDRIKELITPLKGTFNAHIGYDEQLSHVMYAGADFLLMPSRVEPCGLNQMYALRYGTVPVVHQIGGLKDTVIDISKNGVGFVHQQLTVSAICKTISRATKFYSETDKFKKNRILIMQIDHSWDSSAASYISLYNSLIH